VPYHRARVKEEGRIKTGDVHLVAVDVTPTSQDRCLLCFGTDSPCEVLTLKGIGAGDRIRTGDVHLGKVAFCR
jgi:hypothetical protein